MIETESVISEAEVIQVEKNTKYHLHHKLVPDNDLMKLTLKNDLLGIEELLENLESNAPDGALVSTMAHEKNFYGKNAIEMACILGRAAILEAFAKHNIHLDEDSTSGYTLMHTAASWGQVESLRFIDSSCGEVNWQQKNVYGETPEMIAIRYKQDECHEFIQKAIAKTALKDCVKSVRESLETVEKQLSIKISKEDKVSLLRSCENYLEWSNHCLEVDAENGRESSKEEIETKKDELETQLRAVIEKASTPASSRKEKKGDNSRNSRRDSANRNRRPSRPPSAKK